MTERSGEKWTSSEAEDLCRQFVRGLFPSEIAKLHQRSELAIRARLSKCGLLPPLLPDDIERVKSCVHEQSEEIFVKARKLSEAAPSLPVGDVTANFQPTPLLLVDRLYYICPLKNIPSISEHGILSWNEIEKHAIAHADISLQEAQARRARPEPVFERSVHDYVPLYINPRNPMLYLRKDLREYLAIIHVSLNAITGKDHIFTDGNAASKHTSFSRSSSVIESAIEALFAEWWPNVLDGKRRRCAEVLVYMNVPSYLVIGATCYSENALTTCIASFKNAQCVIDKSAFY